MDPRTRDAETRGTRGGEGVAASSAVVTGLTLLAHPERWRVGDRIALPVLAAGHEVRLSRLEPVFTSPDGQRPRPLASTHLSRQPIVLRGGSRGSAQEGSITLDPGSGRTPLVVDGSPCETPITLAAEAIRRGVTLELGHRVVLLLHVFDPTPPPRTDPLGLVGASTAIVRLRQEVERVAEREVPVLLRGETGTGKELVAQALHDRSPRRRGPFVAVNMASLPPSLAAANLFGSVKGAFTGATQSQTGYFRRADGGTLFLDEIGEAPVEIQALLLRALETGEVVPVGAVDPVAVDVRVVTATDLDLEAAITEGRFRSPLLHRIAGYTIRIPPLRERRDDVGRLLFHFLDQEMETVVGSVEDLAGMATADDRPWPPTEVVARLARHDWPGNVRQLRNVARWLAIRGPEGDLSDALEGLLATESDPARKSVEPPTTPAASQTRSPASAGPLRRAPASVGDDELLSALEANGWRIKPTADQLRISRTSLYALIDRCPRIRRAGDLDAEELGAALSQTGGDLDAMSRRLQVSPQGLRQRLQELGLGPGPSTPPSPSTA